MQAWCIPENNRDRCQQHDRHCDSDVAQSPDIRRQRQRPSRDSSTHNCPGPCHRNTLEAGRLCKHRRQEVTLEDQDANARADAVHQHDHVQGEGCGAGTHGELQHRRVALGVGVPGRHHQNLQREGADKARGSERQEAQADARQRECVPAHAVRLHGAAQPSHKPTALGHGNIPVVELLARRFHGPGGNREPPPHEFRVLLVKAPEALHGLRRFEVRGDDANVPALDVNEATWPTAGPLQDWSRRPPLSGIHRG
mmetsp:Transcript_27468/g.78574  ORF Transcript_27468/g.78574 Transcript_27468/m.78574 type:complete len:254 (-) Transcript_27468:52-813(-)